MIGDPIMLDDNELYDRDSPHNDFFCAPKQRIIIRHLL